MPVNLNFEQSVLYLLITSELGRSCSSPFFPRAFTEPVCEGAMDPRSVRVRVESGRNPAPGLVS